MEIIRGLHNLRPRHRGCVVTMGNFDGVHRGHHALLEHLAARRDELGVPSVLITFEPLPREYFHHGDVPARLNRFREKAVLLRERGLDRLLCLPFDERLAATPAHDVIEHFFVGLLGMRHIVVGDDFRFGRGREGDLDMLRTSGARFGFGASGIETLTVGQARVSSSRIRESLAAGELTLAERLLGYPYFMMGRVVYGRHLGRSLGVPTANIRLKRRKAALEGVYAVEVSGLDRAYQGVANVGIKPTVNGKEPLLEVHLFDFDGNLYGRQLKVTFRRKIRDEYDFGSLDALIAQIHRDMDSARRYFASGGDVG